jgi:hypothetical protein
MLEVRGGPRLLGLFPVGEEVGECLRLDGMARLVRDVVDAELDCPLGDPAGCVAVTDNVGEWC